MAYTGSIEDVRGFAPATAQPARPAGRRNIWRRAFARLLIARRHAAEREVAEFVRMSGLQLPESAHRLRRIVQACAAS